MSEMNIIMTRKDVIIRLVQKYTFTFFEKVKVNLTFFKNIFVQVKYTLLDKKNALKVK